jgi:hypothetical protein
VRRRALYDGVDVVFYGNQQSLEYDLILAPGTDTTAIRLAFTGPKDAVIDASGDLHLQLQDTQLVLRKPDAYQEIGGTRHPVEARYVARDDRFGFESRRVRQDEAAGDRPGALVTATTRAAAASATRSRSMPRATRSPRGRIVQTSVNFPIVSAFDGSIGHGDSDAFVQKFNAAGSALIYSTYLGGPRAPMARRVSRSIARATPM